MGSFTMSWTYPWYICNKSFCATKYIYLEGGLLFFFFFVNSSVRKQDFKNVDEIISTAISVSHKNETSETA